MKDSCSALSKLLEKYFDQEVTDEERSLVEAHLIDCHACQEALRSMENLRDWVKAPVEEAVQKEDFQWVWQKIERGIRKEERSTFWETLQPWLQIPPLFKRKVWIPVVATIAVFLFITAQIIFKNTPSYPSTSVVEYIESETNNVMVYESENSKVTVIWLFEEPEEGSNTI
jgi:anti-sigma-K factor RskA